MLLGYLIQPLLNGIFVALTVKRLLPQFLYFVLAETFVG